MPNEKPLAVLLRLDGVIHTSDLPVQSFARHLTEALPADLIRPMIAGMRGFLESRPDLVAAGTDFGQAEDGYQAVRQLALAAGLSRDQIFAAYRASRTDLASSAWAVDAADGLEQLLADLASSCRISVFADPDDPAAPAVLEALDIDGQVELLATPLDAAIARLLDDVDQPTRILVFGTRWVGELDVAAAAGCLTALVDCYHGRRGSPHWQAADLLGLTAQTRSWAGAATIAGTAGPRG